MSVSQKVALRQEKVIVIGFVLLVIALLGVFAYFNFQRQLAEEKKLPDTAPLSVTFGDDSLNKKVIVYIDPVCDKCALYHAETLVPLYDDYVKTGKVKLEIRPISIVTEQSAALTELMMCGSEQGKYWQTSGFVYDALARKNNQTIAVNAVSFFSDFPPAKIASIVDLDESKLASCLQDTRYDDKIKQADAQAYKADVYSTPTTFVGAQEPVRGYSIYPFVKSLVDIEL